MSYWIYNYFYYFYGNQFPITPAIITPYLSHSFTRSLSPAQIHSHFECMLFNFTIDFSAWKYIIYMYIFNASFMNWMLKSNKSVNKWKIIKSYFKLIHKYIWMHSKHAYNEIKTWKLLWFLINIYEKIEKQHFWSDNNMFGCDNDDDAYLIFYLFIIR